VPRTGAPSNSEVSSTMSSYAHDAQAGVLTDPSTFAEFLTFVVAEAPPDDAIESVVGAVVGIEKSIRQKDPEAQLTITMAVSANGWQRLLPDAPAPRGLVPFTALADGDRAFPSTPGDLFLMIKSERMDLNFQAAKYLAAEIGPIGELIEDIQGFKYLDNRDMIDFVDGTENPVDEARALAVLVGDEQPGYSGGSYLTVQRYVDRQDAWDARSTEEQEQVVGRTKMDNVELDDDVKPPWAHNAKSKVEEDGEEILMFRQNRPYGNAVEHGTMFVGFAGRPEVVDTALRQMIIADENGDYDHLLDFVDARTGTNYFVPSRSFLARFGE